MTPTAISWDLGEDRILVLTMDDPERPANTMTDSMEQSLRETVDRLEAERETFDGVILTSSKDTFFAGGDLHMLMNAGPEDAAAIGQALNSWKTSFRRLETLGKPVVAAINGVALGGGFEVALSCHHRIVLDKPGVLLGLPEVGFGILPGAGGVTRTVRMLGITDAMMNVIGQGPRLKPAKALALGIIDEVVATADELMSRARAWIVAHPDAAQPWDRPGYRIPGGTPSSPALAANLPAYPANIRKQLKGAPFPAPSAVLAAAVEGAQVDIDTAFDIETRYCANLICSQTATNMIKSSFFDLKVVNKGAARPKGIPVRPAERVAVLGAGMMGAAIAYVSAEAGIEVVLRDVNLDAAERGKGYARSLLDAAVAKGRVDEAHRNAVLDRIHPTADIVDVKGCDLIVEAVVEDMELKKKVLAEVAAHAGEDALLASNTSGLSIAEMSAAVDRPADVIGMHFFSPVDKMPLVEIVVGENTSDVALARAFDYARQIKKTPIVAKDVYGFYANRVIFKFVDEAVSLVAEGMHPASAEQAALQAGYPTGVLALLDDINLKTIRRVRDGFVADAESRGVEFVPSRAYEVADRMLDEWDRPGRLEGRGYYDYDGPGGKRLGLWPRLLEEYWRPESDIPFEDAKDRLLIAPALEAALCFEEGVVGSVEEANIGSLLGIGFPAWTGGTLQYINQYDGGAAGFIARADELRERYGDRFVVPESLRTIAREDGQVSWPTAG